MVGWLVGWLVGWWQTLPTVQPSFESKVGTMFKPKLNNHHGLGGMGNFKAHSYFKGGMGMAKPPAHKPLPQFQYGGGFGKPPSRGRTTSSSGLDFKVCAARWCVPHCSYVTVMLTALVFCSFRCRLPQSANFAIRTGGAPQKFR